MPDYIPNPFNDTLYLMVRLMNESTVYVASTMPAVQQLVRAGIVKVHGSPYDKDPFTEWIQLTPAGQLLTDHARQALTASLQESLHNLLPEEFGS